MSVADVEDACAPKLNVFAPEESRVNVFVPDAEDSWNVFSPNAGGLCARETTVCVPPAGDA